MCVWQPFPHTSCSSYWLNTLLCCYGMEKELSILFFLFNTSIIIWSSPYLSTFPPCSFLFFPIITSWDLPSLNWFILGMMGISILGKKINKSEFDWTKPQAPCCHEKALLWAATWTRWPPDVPFRLNYSLINMCSLENLGWMFRLAFTKISAISH